jgi:hypothetical protein
MSEDERRKQGTTKVGEHLAEAIASDLNIPVIVINPENADNLFGIAKQLQGIEKIYSQQELYTEVSGFLGSMTFLLSKSDEERKQRIEYFLKSLQTEKSYEARVILPGVIDLPIGTKIGPLEIVEPNLDETLEEHLKYLEDKEKVYLQGRSHGQILFKEYASFNVVDVLYKKLELPIALLSLLFGFDLDVRDCSGLIRSPDTSMTHFLQPHSEIRGWCRYFPDIHANELEKLSRISVDKKPSQLVKKVLQSIQIYGLSRLSRRPEIRFLFLISSFESLLLTKSDRDYLGKKLSEKTAFLLENNYEKRLKLYRLMKGFYGKRSDLVHSGKTDTTEAEVWTLDGIFRALVFRVVELSEQYTKMEQRARDNEKEGIEDYINELKFS